eukprot:scaffold1691_cov378-Prasinococcus_capsulatus_cf.AAC.9
MAWHGRTARRSPCAPDCNAHSGKAGPERSRRRAADHAQGNPARHGAARHDAPPRLGAGEPNLPARLPARLPSVRAGRRGARLEGEASLVSTPPRGDLPRRSPLLPPAAGRGADPSFPPPPPPPPPPPCRHLDRRHARWRWESPH